MVSKISPKVKGSEEKLHSDVAVFDWL
ncbi:hypothetical protein CCACVL1_25345 [Corchorus capsularis]|uniref:Uncharacterized protein n=1 Tax=Corchorus capsularis TaxID=210143 RepID=A0A1R3GL55_COCAP|nr:hypothetical protein CCACVL1_25345 [Corchorus capsularis]